MIASLLAALVLAPASPSCDAAFERLRSEDSVPAAYVAQVAYAHADLGDGEARWFLIDTGANRSALDAGVARDLALPDQGRTLVEGTAGVVETSSTIIARFRMGALDTALSPTVSDLSGLAGPNGEPVAGILGSDAFGDRVVTFDFARGRIAFVQGGADMAADCGRTAPMTDDNGIPRLVGELDGRPVALRYDSGAGLFDSPHLWINLSQPQFAAALNGAPPSPPVQSLSAAGVGGQITLPVHLGRTFRLGGIEWTEPRLIIQPRTGYFARPEAVGFLGNAAFRPFGLVIVDYPGGRLIVPPEA